MRRIGVVLIGIFLILWSGCAVSVGSGGLDIQSVDDLPVIQPMVSNYDDYWDAMRHFDFGYVDRNEVNPEYQEFASGLQLLMEDNISEAEPLFSRLFEATEDSLLHLHAAEILEVIYTHQDKWNELVELYTRMPEKFDESNNMIMAIAYAQSQPENYHFPANPIVLPTQLSISGVPMVEVSVNGVSKKFWIDTGAERTVLSSEIAQKCGVDKIGTETAKVGTATDIKIDMWPGIIENFRIGDLQIENHPVIILNKKDLEVRLFKLLRILKVDGIIGWNAIRNLQMGIDYKNLKTTIQKPEKRPAETRNLHFVTQPLVSLTDTLGRPLYFFLDTGANSTAFYEPALLKVDTTQAKTGKSLIGGAGGAQVYHTKEIPQVAFVLGNHRLDYKLMTTRGDGESGFFFFDGVLGSDIAKERTLILDFQNGRCELKTAQ